MPNYFDLNQISKMPLQQQSTQIYQIETLKKQNAKYKQETLFWQQKYKLLAKQHNQLIETLKKKNFFANDLMNFSECQQTSFVQEKKQKNQQASIQLIQDEEEQMEIPKQTEKSFNFTIKPMKTQIFQSNFNLFENFASQIPDSKCQINDSKYQINDLIKEAQKLTPHTKKSSYLMTQPEQFSPRRNQQFQNNQNQQEIDFFSLQQIQNNLPLENQFTNNQPSQNQALHSKGLDLIEGYFILQKIDNYKQNVKKYPFWIKNASLNTLNKQKNLLQIVYRYTFREQPLAPVQDDPFDSRVNQIKYGTPYQDLLYSFDNFQLQNTHQQDSKIIKRAMRKKFVHCLIRPQIIYIDGKPYETEIMYGFISPFPFKNFFQDLHRTLQQQIKFQILKSKNNIPQEVQVSKDKRVEIVSFLMKDLFDYCQQNCSDIENYPIKLTIQTKVSVIKLDIQSQQDLRKMQRQSLENLLKKYNLSKISKTLHYILSQKQIIVVGTSRKNLNQIHEIIRLMIKPFYWVFPIVYRYSDYFQPFLSSPMPLIIGIVFDFNNRNSKDNQILMGNQLITIFMQQVIVQKDGFFFFSSNKPKYTPSDLRQINAYEKDIQFLIKYLTKVDKKSQSNSSQRIYKYVNRLRNFIQSGSIETQLSPFLIDLMDTQMVQYYNDVLYNNSSKHASETQCNQNLAMTR